MILQLLIVSLLFRISDCFNCNFKEDGYYEEFGVYCYDGYYMYSKISTGSDDDDFYDPVTQGTPYRNTAEFLSDPFSHDKHIVMPLPPIWDDIEEIKIIIFNEELEEAVELNFNPSAGHPHWFKKESVLENPWQLETFQGNIFSMGPTDSRYSFINRNYGGCGNDRGLFVTTIGTYCSWENKYLVNGRNVAILYAKDTTHWNDSPNWTYDTDRIGLSPFYLILFKQKEPEHQILITPNKEEGVYDIQITAENIDTVEVGASGITKFVDNCGFQITDDCGIINSDNSVLEWTVTGNNLASTKISFENAQKCFNIDISTDPDGKEFFSFKAGFWVSHSDNKESFSRLVTLGWFKDVSGTTQIDSEDDSLPPIGLDGNLVCCGDSECVNERKFGCQYFKEEIRDGPMIMKMEIDGYSAPETCKLVFSGGYTFKKVGLNEFRDPILDGINVLEEEANHVILEFMDGVPIPGEEFNEVGENYPFFMELHGEMVCCGLCDTKRSLENSESDVEGETVFVQRELVVTGGGSVFGVVNTIIVMVLFCFF